MRTKKQKKKRTLSDEQLEMSGSKGTFSTAPPPGVIRFSSGGGSRKRGKKYGHYICRLQSHCWAGDWSILKARKTAILAPLAD